MVAVSWVISWIILVCIGMVAVCSTGQAIERWWPTVGLFYFVLLSTGVLVGSYVTAVRLVGVEQAACEEQNVLESINWRKS
jgi:hypothetical protein